MFKKIGPAAMHLTLHLNCGIRGQEVRLSRFRPPQCLARRSAKQSMGSSRDLIVHSFQGFEQVAHPLQRGIRHAGLLLVRE